MPRRGNCQFFLDNIKVLVNRFKGQGKQIFLAGDFNINSLAYSRNTTVRDVFNLTFFNQPFLCKSKTVETLFLKANTSSKKFRNGFKQTNYL